MYQPRISRDLGPLPGNRSFKGNRKKGETLFEVVKSLAIKNQREQPCIFYSLREVANRFKVPVSSVAKVYRELEEQGLLSRVRGSGTVLNGLRNNRKLSVRGFVGLPALISHFITIQDYRTFLIRIRRELWLRGFAATTFFFRDNEASGETLSHQFKDYKVDTVIWLQPGRSAKETLLRVSDMGVRVVSISQVGTPSMPSRYFVWKERAIEALLTDWKNRHLVRKVTVVNSSDYRSSVTEEVLRVCLQNLEIQSANQTLLDQDSCAFLSDLCRIKTDGIIFPVSGLLSMFAFRSSDKLIELLRTQRVAFVDGPIDIPFAKIPDVAVDLVTVNWQSVAESIVHDLITREAFDRNRYTTFEAEAHLGVHLSSFCEEMRPSRGIAASI